jgi:predicted phage terminase large subunit-like protein
MDAQQLSLMKIAQRCRWDLFYLAKYILHYDKMDEFVHGDMCKYAESLYPAHPAQWESPEEKQGTGLQDQFKAGNTNLLILMPRGTFKSSVITIGFSIQITLNDPNARILLDSETFAKSKAFLAEIKGHYEGNEELREIFKTIHGVYPNEGRKKELLWTDSQLNLACRTRPRKEPTFSCGGVDVTKTGMHFDWIIFDDLHSQTNVTNSDQIRGVKEHWRLSHALLDPGKPQIVIGTRWHFDDLYQMILDDYREEFNILVRRAVLPDGKAFFPAWLPLTELTKKKHQLGSGNFSKQYMNEPIDDETATFKRRDMVKREWELIKDRPINWYLSVDPSYAGEYSDYAALVVVGMDYQRELYVRHVTREKMTYSDIINKIFELHQQYNPKLIIIETVFAQKSIMYELTNEMKRRGAWLPIQEIKQQSKSKEERIRALAPFYEFHHIFHVKGCPQLDELEYELLRFPSGKNDDTIDALANVLGFAQPPSAKTKMYTNSYPDDPKRNPYRPVISRITGY